MADDRHDSDSPLPEAVEEAIDKAAASAAEFPNTEHAALFVGAWLATVLMMVGRFGKGANRSDRLVENVYERVVREAFPDLDDEVAGTLIRGLLYVLIAAQDAVSSLVGVVPLTVCYAGISKGTETIGEEWHRQHAKAPDPVKLAAAVERVEADFAKMGVKVDLSASQRRFREQRG